MSESRDPLQGGVLLSVNGQTEITTRVDEVKCIAQGGMAFVYRARQPSLDRYVVLKKLKDEFRTNAELLERFRREARALASVLHQNVAHVYDYLDRQGESFILMEYIDGVDLSTIIEKVGHLPPRVAASILLGIARGTGFIHAHNLIHRDIKPSNIRLTNRGGVKLMDFGIVMDIHNTALTRPGVMVGSPSYLSPEQVLGDPVTPKADQFLLGIVLYEMLTGVRPFKEEGGATVFQKIREADYVGIRKMQPQVPRTLERIADRLLRRDSDDRYDGMKELVSELERFLGPYDTTHTEDRVLKYLDDEALLTPAVEYHWQEESPSHRFLRRRWPWLAGMAATFLVAIALGYRWGRSQSTLHVEGYPPPIAGTKTPRK